MRFVAFALMTLTALGCGKKTSPDLMYASPGDALILHVRFADAFEAKAVKELLSLLNGAGAPVWVEKEFGLMPDRIDALTLAMPEGQNGKPGLPRILIRTKDDTKAEALFPGREREPITVPGFNEAYKLGRDLLIALDAKRFLVLPEQAGNAASLKFEFSKEGPLSPAFEAIAAGKSHLFFSASPTAVKSQKLPGEFAPIGKLIGNDRVPLLALTAGDDLKIKLTLIAKDSDAADAAGKAMSDALTEAKKDFERSVKRMAKDPFIASVQKMLNDAEVTSSGKSRSLTAVLPIDANGITQFMNAVRGNASRTNSVNNLKQIGLALHVYNDANNALPGIGVVPKGKAKPGLSWRVAVLPFIEQGALYNRFKLDEPWDSEHNKKLIPLMPKVYVIPGTEADAKLGKTHYRMFDTGKNYQLQSMPDGTSNTIAVVEAAEAVVWTKPEELDPKSKDLHALIRWGWDGGESASIAMFDGSIRALKKAISAKTLKDAIIPDDGNVLGSDF